MHLEITIDTREQTPFHFPPEIASVTRGTLRTGDYALTGDSGFAVERKSFDDFLGTISSGWERFCREVGRARDAGFVLPVVVEGWLDDCVWHDDGELLSPRSWLNHPSLSPAMVLSRIGRLWALGACVIPCGTVASATAITWHLLKERKKGLLDEQERTLNQSQGK